MPSGLWSWSSYVHWQLGDPESARQDALKELELHPDNTIAVQFLARLDVDADRPDRALARWEEYEPRLSTDEGEFCHADYGYALIADGQTERARRFLLPCPHQREESEARAMTFYTEQMYIHALLGNREETLDFMEKLVLEEGWRRQQDILLRHEFDFLEDDPRFERLMAIMDEDIALQLERVREMAARGELDPSPDVR